MNILIFDPLQHFPASHQILSEGTYPQTEIVYLSFFDNNSVYPNRVYRDLAHFKKKYKFNPADADNTDLSNIHFDVIFLVYPAYFYWPDKVRNKQNIDLFEKCMKIIGPLRRSSTKLALIDNDDYPHDPTSNPDVTKFKFNVVLKREKLATRNYSEKVMPFPFAIFGFNDPVYSFLNRSPLSSPIRSNRAYWAGTPFIHQDLEAGMCIDRKSLINELLLQDSRYFNIRSQNVSHRKYVAEMTFHHFAINLLGVGQLTKRFFESLTYGAIPLMQLNNLAYPVELSKKVQVLKELEWKSVEDLSRILDLYRSPSKRKDLHASVRDFAAALDYRLLAHLMLKDL